MTQTPMESAYEQHLAAFVGSERLENLRSELGRKAKGELDLRWFTHETPIGPLLVAVHRDHVVRIAFGSEGFEAVHEQLSHSFGLKTLRSDRGLEGVRRELDEYFAGTRQAFDVPIAFSLTRGEFRVSAQKALSHIAYGTTLTYSQLADAAGRPAAVRAAASACATNPLPIVVPCHRVVRADGTPGGYLGGAAAKEWLLRHEGGMQRA